MSSAAAHRSPRTRVSRVRVAATLMACALSVGVAGVPVAASAAGDEGDSSITVKWLNDDSRAADLQPARETTHLSPAPSTPGEVTNPHYEDFKNLQVTVSETQDLTDQVVHLDVSGMPGRTVGNNRTLPGLGAGQNNSAFQQNFLQVMQCWGDPAAEDFAETCQFGVYAAVDSINSTLSSASASRAAAQAQVQVQVPFRSVQGVEYFGSTYGMPAGTRSLADILAPGTTNEKIVVSVAEDGTASFDFEVFTSAQAPWLGCGVEADGAAPQRCYLVIVPRGTIYGGKTPSGATSSSPSASYGQFGAQNGSPIHPDNDYWDNRIVVPLDFASRRESCQVGGGARLLGGSQLVESALTSWQKSLCAEQGLGVSFATSADARGREQLLQGDVRLAFTSRPAVEDELDELSGTLLADTELVYAPVTVSGITIGFALNGRNGIKTDLTLTPRLIAKLLTQSYVKGVPGVDSEYPADHLPAAAKGDRVQGLMFDPEFTALNKEISRLNDTAGDSLGKLVVMGPSGADGVRLLWDYLQADDKARAFLEGEPDNVLLGDEGNSGMRINPYYLPKGDPDAMVPVTEEVDTVRNGLPAKTLQYAAGQSRAVGLTDGEGNPLSLATATVDTFPQADESLVPWELVLLDGGTVYSRPTSRIDAVTANPYGETFAAVARRIFRGDPKSPMWDATKTVQNGDTIIYGAWSTLPAQLPPFVRVLGTTDTSSAAEYQLATAQLQLPNKPGTYVAPTTASMTSALGAQRPVAGGDTSWASFGDLADDAYPLTVVTYAAVNATLLADEPEERGDYADLIEYAATDGQVSGDGAGELPAGYAPLSADLVTQATAAAACLRTYDPSVGCQPSEPTPSPTPVAQSSSATTSTSGAAATTAAAAAGSSPTAQTGYTQSASSGEPEATAEAAPAAGGAVGGTLVAGLVGAAVAPFLLRRRPTP